MHGACDVYWPAVLVITIELYIYISGRPTANKKVKPKMADMGRPTRSLWMSVSDLSAES